MAAIVVPIAVHPKWTGTPRAMPAPARRALPATNRPLPASVYRRRQLVAALLVVIAIAAVVAGVRWSAGALGGAPLNPSERRAAQSNPSERGAAVQLDVRPISRSVYVVQPGDTMWAIAHRMAPDGDVRPVVDRLVAQLHGRALTPGTRLIVS